MQLTGLKQMCGIMERKCSGIPHVCLTNRRKSVWGGREGTVLGKEEKAPVSMVPQKEC